MTIVQVCGCIVEDDQVTPNVPDSMAHLHSAYLGEPGAMEWLADFKEKAHALKFGKQLAKELGAVFEDKTYPEAH
jgi:hypothetical protein